jgi:ketosteroid isomerase-like protein
VPTRAINARRETVSWLERYYSLIDAGRVREAAQEFLDESCTIRLGNEEPTGLLEQARRISPLISGTRHRLINVLETDDGTLACELEITYIKRDGTSVTLPGSLFATVRGGRFVQQRAYVDHAPLL